MENSNKAADGEGRERGVIKSEVKTSVWLKSVPLLTSVSSSGFKSDILSDPRSVSNTTCPLITQTGRVVTDA